jgi:hypothetical protein
MPGSDAASSRPGTGDCPPARSILVALLAAVLFGAFLLAVDRGCSAAGDRTLWVALGIQLGPLPPALGWP